MKTVKKCQKWKRVNESEHHQFCQDCWEKKKIKDFSSMLKEFSKRKEVNESKSLQKLVGLFEEIIKPMNEKFKVVAKATRDIKRKKVWEHKMDSGDYFKVYLLDKPRLNDVDDIEVEMNGVYGTTAFGIQDWEALALCDGLMKAILKKYGSHENAVKELVKSGKILIKGDKINSY